MRPADAPPPPADEAYVATLAELTRPFGVTHTGIAPADVLTSARAALDDRVRRGLTDGMQFTFKNPERSTDPRRAVRGAQAVFVAARPYLLADADTPPALRAASGSEGGPEARESERASGPEGGPDVRESERASDAGFASDSGRASGSEGPRGERHGVPGRVARYAWVDHYAPLREALWAVTRRLRADGWKAVPFADDNSIVDREVAYRAGIGWYGKNANLLLPGAGSWFVLGCVITTAPLPAAQELVADGCGRCRKCLDGCPTGAIVAPGVIDASRCLAWVLQKPGDIPVPLREAVGDRLYGCDDCQEVCPPAVRLGPRLPAPAPTEPVRAWVDVLDLLLGDDEAVMARWGRWYLAERDPRWVRRNALVVLGNTGDPGDATVRRVLAEYRAHPDPVLRDHAVWATERLGLEAR